MSKLTIATAPNLWHGIPYEDDAGKRKLRATVKCNEVSWPQLCKALGQIKTAAKKEKAPYFVMAKFKEVDTNGEYTRRNANIVSFSGATLDIDDGPYSYEEVEAILQDLGWNFFIYTTHSYDPWTAGRENKFRVVIPYTSPVEPKMQPFVIIGIAARMGINQTYDKASEVASQPMYWHSAPKDRIKDGMFDGTTTGDFLDPDEVYELGKMAAEEHGYGSSTGKAVSKGTDLDEGDRHDQFKRHLARCRKEGMTVDDAIGDIHVWNSKLSNPLPDDQIEGLRRVWETFERNNNAFGFEHHRHNIEHMGVREKSVYDAVMQQVANSKDELDAAELKELFELIKKNRPGSTLKTIEAHHKELTADIVFEESADLQDLRIKVDAFLAKHCNHMIWVAEQDKVYSRKNGVGVVRQAFKTQIGKLYEKAFDRFGPLFLELKLGREYALDHGLVREVARQGYYPGSGEIYEHRGVEHMNTYREPQHDVFEGDVTPLLEHLDYLIPHPKEREWFISMLAFTAQNPGQLIRYMFVIEGGKGIGKSLLRTHLLEPLFGDSNVQEVTKEMLADDKKGWVSTSQVDVFEEFAFPDNRSDKASVHNFLKKYTANDNIPRRAMRSDYIEVPNFSLKLAFKNPEDKIMVERGDRRYVIVRGPRKPKTESHYDKLVTWLEDEMNKAAVRHFFHTWNYDAHGFTPDFPLRTAFTQEVATMTDEWPASVLDLATDHPDTPLDSFAPLMYETDLVKLIVAMTSGYGYEAKKAERLLAGNRLERSLMRDTLEGIGCTCLTPDRFKRAVGPSRKWERVWFMAGGSGEELAGYLERFDWQGHKQELHEFSVDVGDFIKTVHKEREQDEETLGADWEEGETI